MYQTRLPIQFQIVQYMLVDDDSKHPSLRTVATFLKSSQEVSAPYPSAYSRLLFYFSGTGNSEVAYSLDLQTMQSTAMTPTSACYSYFPIAGLSGESVFVTAGLYESRVCSSNDQIFLGTPGGGFTQLPFNGCLINNSDPAPLDSSHTLFSSTLTGNYRAYLGNNSSGGTVWALTPIGLGAGTTDLRGMSYTTERLWVPAAN